VLRAVVTKIKAILQNSHYSTVNMTFTPTGVTFMSVFVVMVSQRA
jgi:hypothetical protein